MNIYHLERREPVGHDECEGFVVLARGEEAARRLVAGRAGDEGAEAWRDPARSFCFLIGDSDATFERIILRSFRAG